MVAGALGSLYSCSKSNDAIPNPSAASGTADAKGTRTTEYVGKNVQITGYEDGRERPTRFKTDASDDVNAMFTTMGRGPGVGPFKFVSSEGYSLNGGDQNPGQYIVDLEIAKSSYASVGAQSGYYKLDLDLNSGAGGKYIYLCFSRNQVDDHNNNCGLNWADLSPITDITTKAWRTLSISSRPDGFCYIYNGGGVPDLNDGSGGRYVYPYQTKSASPNPIKEVGVVAGNTSNIFPPPGWVRAGEDCNAGAGGDYIYLCYKRG